MASGVLGHGGVPAPELPGGVEVGQGRLPQSLRAFLSGSRLQDRLRGAAAGKEWQGPPGRLSIRIKPCSTPGVDPLDLAGIVAALLGHILQQLIQILPPGLGHQPLHQQRVAGHGTGDEIGLFRSQGNSPLSRLGQGILCCLLYRQAVMKLNWNC